MGEVGSGINSLVAAVLGFKADLNNTHDTDSITSPRRLLLDLSMQNPELFVFK